MKWQEQRLTESETAKLNVPTAQCEGLPGRVYVDPEFYELERQTLFRNGWVAAAFEQDIPEPGDVFPASVAGWELLFVRTRDNAVRCFHNICRHRGMKLVREPAKDARTLMCPWHCWTYSLDGALVGTPNLGGPEVAEVEGIDKSTLGLVEVRCEQWWNFLFVNIDGNAPPLSEHMAPLDSRTAHFDRSELACSGEGFSFAYDGNWKVLIEGAIEDYHFPWVHPQLMPQGVFSPEIGEHCYAGISSRPQKPGDRAKMVGGEDDGTAGPLLPKFSYTADQTKVEMGVYIAMPSAVVAFNQDHAVTSLFTPVSHDRTVARRLFHYIGAEAARGPEYEKRRQRIMAGWRTVGEQDADYVDEVHNLSKIRQDLGIGIRLSPFWEPAVHHFQKMVVERTDPCGSP